MLISADQAKSRSLARQVPPSQAQTAPTTSILFKKEDKAMLPVGIGSQIVRAVVTRELETGLKGTKAAHACQPIYIII